MNIEFKDFIELLKVICWPIVAGIAIVVFKEPLLHFLEAISTRATKLSAFQFAVELSKVPEFTPAWSAPYLSDVRQPSPSSEFTSGAMALFEQIRDDTASDYAIVDLGTGHQWLTSRLFIFALILERMRGLKCLVFLETAGEIRRRYIGTASPAKIRWALAHRYPWLETAFANAYSQIPNHQIHSLHGALETYAATELVRIYLEQIQMNEQPNSEEENQWVKLGDQQIWEHARWIDGAKLIRILGNDLQASWVPYSPDVPPTDQAKAVLRREGPFIAIVEDGRVFRELVDRQALIEKTAKQMAEDRFN